MDREVPISNKPLAITLSLKPKHIAILDTIAAQMPRTSDPRKSKSRSAAARELIEAGNILWSNPTLMQSLRNGGKVVQFLNELLSDKVATD